MNLANDHTSLSRIYQIDLQKDTLSGSYTGTQLLMRACSDGST